MDFHLLYIIAIIGAGCLTASFLKMKTGFGPFNLRVIGIVLIATFATLLAVAKENSLNSAMGILGAIAGYLFGLQESKEKGQSSSVGVESSQFGDNAKIVGRDINETIEKMSAEVANINNQINRIDKAILTSQEAGHVNYDYLINTIYERNVPFSKPFEKVVRHWEQDGWKLVGFSSDYNGIDGIMLLFSRESTSPTPSFSYYHGSEMSKG